MEKDLVNEKDILASLLTVAEKKGDLPIFNASLNNVRRISSDTDAHSMELAQTVMKDANLSIKLLRVANSPYYSRGPAKIASISRAVVILGFEVIKSLCLTLKLIESFQDENTALNMNKMVARSYLTAGFVRDIALKSNIKNAEETYICGLCHSLGETTLAYFMPDTFLEIQRVHKETECSWEDAQLQVLGMTLSQIGQALAKTWNFSDQVIKNMTEYRPNADGMVKNPHQLSHAIVSLCSKVIDNIYLNDARSKQSLRELFSQLEVATGIKASELEHSLGESFTRSCELIKSYGLSPLILQPEINETEDNLRDKLTRDFSFFASSQNEDINTSKTPAKSPQTVSGSVLVDIPSSAIIIPATAINPTISNKTGANQAHTERGDPMAQLTYIQEITTLVTDGAPLGALFLKILQGLKESVGFDRVALSLVTPDRRLYATRLCLGDDEGVIIRTLNGKTDPKRDIFARIIEEGGDLLIDDINDGTWDNLLPADFKSNAKAKSFIIAGLKRGPKPVGLFYADNALTDYQISPNMRRSFLQFVAQSRLAVQIVN